MAANQETNEIAVKKQIYRPWSGEAIEKVPEQRRLQEEAQPQQKNREQEQREEVQQEFVHRFQKIRPIVGQVRSFMINDLIEAGEDRACSVTSSERCSINPSSGSGSPPPPRRPRPFGFSRMQSLLEERMRHYDYLRQRQEFYQMQLQLTACPRARQDAAQALARNLYEIQMTQSAITYLENEIRQYRLRPKKFKCALCPVAFSNNGQLQGHMRIHTGERPFICQVESCKKAFTRNEELTRHKRIHTGARPYPCIICGKAFGRKDHLKKHERIHPIPLAYSMGY